MNPYIMSELPVEVWTHVAWFLSRVFRVHPDCDARMHFSLERMQLYFKIELQRGTLKYGSQVVIPMYPPDWIQSPDFWETQLRSTLDDLAIVMIRESSEKA